jgi:hypothetical protein
MADLQTLVHNEMDRAGSPSYSFDDLGRRRDRKRRNKRITAGVVGIVVALLSLATLARAGMLTISSGPRTARASHFLPRKVGSGSSASTARDSRR